jgi:hypothetical protein
MLRFAFSKSERSTLVPCASVLWEYKIVHGKKLPVVSLLSPGGAPGVLDQPVRIRPDRNVDFDSRLLYIIT